MLRTTNTVGIGLSGADSVPPSRARWEETTTPFTRRRSSHHEAHPARPGFAGGHRAVRRGDVPNLASMAPVHVVIEEAGVR